MIVRISIVRRYRAMHHSQHFLFHYWILFVSLIVLGRVLIHWRIYPELRRRGVSYKIGGIGDHRAVGEYKRICVEEGRPLTLWYMMTAIWVILYAGIVVWFCLIFSIV
jgi:hypothetical protein